MLAAQEQTLRVNFIIFSIEKSMISISSVDCVEEVLKPTVI